MLKRFFIVLAIGLAAPHLSAQVNVQLEALKRLKDIDLAANPAIKKVVLDLLEASRGQAAFVEIVRDFKLRGHEAELLRYAQAHPNDSTGVEAIRLLLNDAGLKLIRAAIDGEHAADTVAALANAQAPEAGPVLLRLARDAKKPLALRTIAINGLAKAKTGAKELLTEAKAGRLPADLNFAAGNRTPFHISNGAGDFEHVRLSSADMAAALEHIDLFAPAHNLKSLVALEPYFAAL